MTEYWDLRFIEMAKTVSTWSKDPSTQTGSVLVRPDKTIISLGFNGFPRKLVDTEERLHDRETKYGLIIHAEMNAILNAKTDLEGAWLYNWPMQCCLRCAVHIVQAGIVKVVAPEPDPFNAFYSRWIADIKATEKVFAEAGVVVRYYQVPVV